MGLTVVGSIQLLYLVSDRDRHGNVRYYVRRPGARKVRLRSEPHDASFMAEYAAAMTAVDRGRRKANKIVPGSVRAACIGYYASAAFQGLDPYTQTGRRRYLDGIATEHGEKPIASLPARKIREWRDAKAATPHAANAMLKALRALFVWTCENDMTPANSVRDVKPIRTKGDGHHTWTQDEMAQFEARHPLGSRGRLAFALLRYTACRREDVVRLGRQHIKDGRLRYVQGKNEHVSPVSIDIPVHRDLAAAIAAAPSEHLTFLTTQYGKPFAVAGFGNWFRDRCDEAELKHCSAHGIRKATSTELAENEATPHEIMSITGHRTLSEVERYTRAARSKNLATSAMLKLKG